MFQIYRSVSEIWHYKSERVHKVSMNKSRINQEKESSQVTVRVHKPVQKVKLWMTHKMADRNMEELEHSFN
jgi:hypothetical protein